MEGRHIVPLRIPRLATAVTAIGLAAAPVLALGAPAFAGSVVQREWWLTKLHVTQAWRTSDGGGITVAVLADGVDASPDLSGSVINGPDFTHSGRKAGGKYYGTIGTGLASLIAGHGYGAKTKGGRRLYGIYGIVDEAKILSVRVTLSPHDPLWSNSKVTSRLPGAIAAGIRYAVAHRAAVIDLPPDPGLPGIAGWGDAHGVANGSAAERSAIKYAVGKGVVVVAPAGDNGQVGDAVDYPAAYPGVISVGAFNDAFVKAPFSSRQPYVTLTAAGEGMVAAAPNGGYQTMNSTWAASAIVSGIAALLRSAFPSLSASQVRTAMTSGTVYHPAKGRMHGSGYGTVDALGAIRMAAKMSPPHAIAAMTGALPKRRPATPRMPPRSLALSRELVRDGEISGAVLVCLLVPISIYGLAVRRRDRRQAAAMARRANQSPAQGAGQGMLADPLLEYFGPQHASPALPPNQRAPVSTRYQPRPALAGRSTLSARPALAAPVAALPPGTQPPSVPETSFAGGGGQSVSSAPPAVAAQLAGYPQQVSQQGAPPWEIDARAWESGAPPWENQAPPWESDEPPWHSGPPWETGTADWEMDTPAIEASGPAAWQPSAPVAAAGAPPWQPAVSAPATDFGGQPPNGAPASPEGSHRAASGSGPSPSGLPLRRPRHVAAASGGADFPGTDQPTGGPALGGSSLGGGPTATSPFGTGQDVIFPPVSPPVLGVPDAGLAGAGLAGMGVPGALPDVGVPASQPDLSWPASQQPAADPASYAGGTPPWEPAPEPTTALPWATAPADPTGPEAAGAGFQDAGAPQSPFDPRLPWPADPASGAQSTSETGGRPIYVWNPTSATTDSFERPDLGGEPDSQQGDQPGGQG